MTIAQRSGVMSVLQKTGCWHQKESEACFCCGRREPARISGRSLSVCRLVMCDTTDSLSDLIPSNIGGIGDTDPILCTKT